MSVGQHTTASTPPAAFEAAYRALMTSRPVAYYPCLAQAVGSVTAGVLLSQFSYWSSRTTDPEGWIWKTRQHITEETGLSRREQDTARRILRDAGILYEKREGLPARLYFRVDIAAVAVLLAQPPPIEPPDPGDEPQSSLAESAQHSGRKAPNTQGGKRPTFNTEITTESTNRECEGSAQAPPPPPPTAERDPNRIRRGRLVAEMPDTWYAATGRRLNAGQLQGARELEALYITADRYDDYCRLYEQAMMKGWRWSGLIGAWQDGLTEQAAPKPERDRRVAELVYDPATVPYVRGLTWKLPPDASAFAQTCQWAAAMWDDVMVMTHNASAPAQRGSLTEDQQLIANILRQITDRGLQVRGDLPGGWSSWARARGYSVSTGGAS